MSALDFGRARPRVAIMGMRGIPGSHGGFETFAERLAPRLASSGWDVSAYCQEDSPRQVFTSHIRWQTVWEGVQRIHIAVGPDTPINSIRYDYACISDVLKERPDVVLILGYNTAMFALRLRWAGIAFAINMDGIEWSRQKWGLMARCWLYLNERAACWSANHLVADHPQIARHLRSRVSPKEISVIPYGADILEPQSDEEILRKFGVTSMRFATVIARPEPENSILEMVRAFSCRERGIALLVLGRFNVQRVRYHADIAAAASDEVRFPGAVYDKATIEALRRHSLFYMHGHQVGGCNPSLVEAMGAGRPVLAHDNRFNRWVVRDGAVYFSDEATCERAIEKMMQDPQQYAMCGVVNRRRATDVFNWNDIVQSYDVMLSQVASEGAPVSESGWGRRPVWQSDVDTS